MSNQNQIRIEIPADSMRLRKAADLLRVSVKAVQRYTLHGVRGPSGQRIKLRAIKVGGLLRTTLGWVNEFVAAFNTDPPAAGAVNAPNTEPPTAGPQSPLISSTQSKRDTEQFLDREAEAVRAALGA